MYHRGLGMRILGRLAMAAALLVPVGIVAAGSASASGGGFNCSGTSGTATATPGLLLSTGKPQQTAISSSGLTCTGGFVTGGRLKASIQTTTTNCAGLVGKTSNGAGTLTWTDAGMGKSTAKLNFKVTSSVGHVTSGTITGVITTSGSNLAAGKAVSGAFTLNKGLRSTASGGDCTVTIPLTSFGITAISLHT
jgi:hypothetical protein